MKNVGQSEKLSQMTQVKWMDAKNRAVDSPVCHRHPIDISESVHYLKHEKNH